MADAIHDLTAAYALDALDERERSAFEAHLSECEECRRGVRELWRVSGALGYAAAGPPPPAELRGRILDAVRAERAAVVPLRRRRGPRVAVAVAAAASLAAVGFATWAASLSRELDRTRDASAQRQDALAVLADPAARRIALTTPHGSLVVAPDGRAALVLVDVAPAPEGKIYEIWVVEDGTPRSAGVFEGAPARTVVSVDRSVGEGDMITITLESEDGTPAPEGPRVTGTPRI